MDKFLSGDGRARLVQAREIWEFVKPLEKSSQS